MVSIWLLLFLINLLNHLINGFQGTSCTLNNGKTEGICKSIESCPFIIDDIQKGRLYEICGYDKTVLIVCCPSNFSTTTEAPNTRISERKCDEYKEAVYEYVESVSIFRNEEIYKRKVDKCGNRNLTTDLPYGEYSHGREFPHMASLGFVNKRNQTKWFCGASLISEQYVLTAAHCLHIDEYGPVQYVRLGELNFESVFDDAKPEDFEIAEHISHPNYTEELYYNDIALIKLKRAVKLNPYKRPACLPSIIEEPPKYAIATGWGHDKFGGKRSTHLIKVTLEKFSSDICFENFKDVLYSLNRGTPNETQICYGSNDGRDTCTGDSGGPLQAFHPEFHCMYTIYGITSLGIGCGFIGVPAVYTRVSAYIDWIESVVWKGS